MQIGDHEITFILLLHPNIVADSAKIVSQVQKSCGPYATHYNLFPLFHKATKIRIVQSQSFGGGMNSPKPLSRLPAKKYICPMEVNDALIDKLAHLARLKFEDSEKEEIKNDLQKMIAFVEKLNELDTTGVEPLLHMTDEINSLREDELKLS